MVWSRPLHFGYDDLLMTPAMVTDERTAHQPHLRAAARLAMRGHGGAEPNPMVGCVIVAPDGEPIGWGYHRTCGEAHAEINALARADRRARGATAYVTLEPCNHHGRTRPCTEALIEAGIARVVIARRDPHPEAAGGIVRLREAGIDVQVTDICPEAIEVSDPFVQRVRTGLPWVVAKWAQTLDGRIATRTGDSKWISSQRSRRLVHRERGRVDAILTGIGTVLADDPLLTARDVRVRRVARRIVIDPKLRIPLDAQLVRTAADVPCTVVCAEHIESDSNGASKIEALRAAGIDIIPQAGTERSAVLGDDKSQVFPMRTVLRDLAERYDLTTVLVEAGGGVLTSLLREKLINDFWVMIGAKLIGDRDAPAAIEGLTTQRIDQAVSLELRGVRRCDGDVQARYRPSHSR